jgi:hypothetical protein
MHHYPIEQHHHQRPHPHPECRFFIIIIALAINFIGDGLRDAFDPRQRRFHIATDGLVAGFRRLVARKGVKPDVKK